VAIPAHALVFFIKRERAEENGGRTDGQQSPYTEKNIPWKLLTFIDS
jgi:hypothetical protein